jgi:hypothetical protein
MNTFEATCSSATQHTTSYEAVMLHPSRGRREANPSSDEGAPSDVTIHSGTEGIKCGKKWRM